MFHQIFLSLLLAYLGSPSSEFFVYSIFIQFALKISVSGFIAILNF